MRITDVDKMRDVVTRMKTDDANRGKNRARINDMFNGGAPYTDKEAEENGIYTNVQPMIAPRIAHDARRQIANATQRTAHFFRVQSDFGPPELKRLISAKITNGVNRHLKRSRAFAEVLRGTDANVILHGRGPSMWDDDQRWCPKLISVEDLKIPGNVYIDFSNLTHFAVFQRMSAAELMRHISGPNANKDWNVPAVKRLIKRLADEVLKTPDISDQEDFPEKLAEDFKQNGLYYATDVVPTASVWFFYQLTDDEGEPRWELCVFEDAPAAGENPVSKKDEYLFKQTKNFAPEACQILHVQYGDGANVAPFMYHSVRGLGFMLYPALQLSNRMFCRFMDSIFEAMNQLFRNVGEADREKLSNISLANMSTLPPGTDFVPANERYTVNHNLVNAGISLLKQYIAENSASFLAEPDSGTSKEMTATQVMANVQQASVLVSSLLQMQTVYRKYQYEEICRRFCVKNSRDKDVRAFLEAMRQDNVPDQALDFERWTVIPERVIGGGNKTLELVQASELMAARPAYSPQAQQIILHDYTLALTDDPDKTELMVPVGQQPPSRSNVFATLAFGSLMQGTPVLTDENINIQEYAGTLLDLLTLKVRQEAQLGKAPDEETVVGLMNVGRHIETALMQIGQDPARAQVAKQGMQRLAELMKVVGQWAAETGQQEGDGEIPPEVRAKIAAASFTAQSQAQIKEAQAAQKMKQRQEAHEQRVAQDQVKLQAEIEAQDYKTAAEIQRDRAKAAAEPKEKPE